MATSVATIDVSAFTTDAKFRNWVTAVHDAMAAAGFVQTSDTGQIVPATVLKPTAITTLAGYEIWRFNDTLQATAPVFLKLAYYSSTVASGNGVALLLTVGTGVNGAGTITGTTTGVMVNGAFSASAALNQPNSVVQACHTAGFGLIQSGAYISASQHAGFWVIARTCDADGALTGEGVVIYRQNTASSSLTTVIGLSFSAATMYAARNPAAGMLLTTGSMAGGSSIPLGKNYAPLGVPVRCHGALSYYSTDIAAGSTFTATPWGTTPHTYISLSALLTPLTTGMDAVGTVAVNGAFLWE